MASNMVLWTAAVENYGKVASLLKGAFLPSSNSNSLGFSVDYAIRDYGADSIPIKRTFRQSFQLINGHPSIQDITEVEAAPKELVVFNERTRLTARLRNVEGKNGAGKSEPRLLLFKQQQLVKALSLKEAHGAFPLDQFFGTASIDDNGLVYVAEELGPDDSGKDASAFKFAPNFGERLFSVRKPKLYFLSFNQDEASAQCPKQLNIPDNVAPSTPVLMPNGDIYFIGYNTEPLILGLNYCFNRPAGLFRIPKGSSRSETVFSADSLYPLRSLTVVSSGKLAFIRSQKLGGSHFPAGHVCVYDPQSQKLMVDEEEIFADQFIGTSGDALILNIPVRSNDKILVYNSMSGERTYVESSFENGSIQALAVIGDFILCRDSSPIAPHVASLYNMASKSFTMLPGIYDTIPESVANLSGSSCGVRKLHEFCDYIYILPGTPNGKTLAMPHGGPNGNFPTMFGLHAGMFLSAGYALLVINYTGSTGYGSASIARLEGHIGKYDIEDTVNSIKDFQSRPQWSHYHSHGIYFNSGSHGGYIGAMITGLYPDLFKAVALRNPVTDLPSMAQITDIKDWPFGQTGIQFDMLKASPPSEEQLISLMRFSPSAHVSTVKTPTLLLIGEKDLRVPPTQGYSWYYWLKSLGAPVSILSFPDADHSLDTPISECNSWIATLEFFDKY